MGRNSRIPEPSFYNNYWSNTFNVSLTLEQI